MADRLLESMTRSAARRYGGEAVSELDHALQCAELAAWAGADEELVLAALLHDVGRYAVPQSLVSDATETTSEIPEFRLEEGRPTAWPEASAGAVFSGARRGHHDAGADLIAPWVPKRVAWCVRMHADAKRYLCATEPQYYALLSPASQRTLLLQGGVMTPAEVETFRACPWLDDALALRRWDDQAKVPGAVARLLASWAPLLRKYFDP
jgi:[1-hydroxy-2-(trimethylamino)ethyl]phosphonate dioxygenase